MKEFTLPPKLRNIPRLLEELHSKPQEYWIKRGEQRALRLFWLMSERVPAYKDFLKKHRVGPNKIKTIKDFKSLPLIDKDNYLRKYTIEQLCWNGEFKERQWVLSTTSGSTGDPFYFPREKFQELQYAVTAELYLRTNFDIENKSTLYIVAFPMGAWIGGLFTYQALSHIAQKKKYRLSIITPGINKTEVLNAVKQFGDKFDQIIIGSYAPFLKDILDDGEREGIQWKNYNLGFIFSAEGFTEEFRDYVIQKTGLTNIYKDTLNHYGTVDLGTMSYETPISILARRIAIKNKEVYSSLFGDTLKLPTLTQFMPEMFFFEEIEGNLICSASSGIPLVRYDLKDHGGIITFNDMKKIYKDANIDILEETKNVGIADTVWNLPFVYIYERSDFSISFYAFNIYPETIKRALQKKRLEKIVTGKFTMLVRYDKKQNQYIEINIELKHGLKTTATRLKVITDLIVKQLLVENSEYRETYDKIGKQAVPRIILWPYEDLQYFQPGIKQKWVKKLT